MSLRGGVVLQLAIIGVCGSLAMAFTQAGAPAAPAPATVHALALPGAPPSGGVFMDYIAYDRVHHRLWVPAGNTASVDVVDTRTEKITQLAGFPTAEFERGGTKRTVGPSSASVGEKTVYVGSRGDSSVCALDSATLDTRANALLEMAGLAGVDARVGGRFERRLTDAGPPRKDGNGIRRTRARPRSGGPPGEA